MQCRWNARPRLVFSGVVVAVIGSGLFAQTSRPEATPAAGDSTAVPASQPSKETGKPGPMSLSYYVPSPGYGTRGETEPPRYARTLSKVGIPSLAELDWLDFGLDHRTRFEYRDDDYRRTELTRDLPFLLRSRGYLGIHDILDPFRFVVEFQDARRFHSQFAEDDRDVDENDIIQMYAGLFFKDALGSQRPFQIQAGRFAFDYLDRRLLSRNPWRNTTNSFDGFRAILGQQKNDWQVDIMAMQPVERRLSQPDRTNEEEWFYAVIGQWRRWSKIITLQPYYLIRDQDRKDPAASDREIHTFALRGYGLVGQTGLDYDFDVAWQCGRDGDRNHRAFGGAGEVGYTFKHAWKPRVSGSVGYASGDRNPTDGVNERFDRNFGFARPWSANDYFIWENMITPKVRLEIQPHKQITYETCFQGWWLASDSDSWANARRRDPTGRSGDCIGQELDMRVRCQIDPRVEVIVGYAHFMPGNFTRNTGDADDSDFMYVETTFQLFK